MDIICWSQLMYLFCAAFGAFMLKPKRWTHTVYTAGAQWSKRHPCTQECYCRLDFTIYDEYGDSGADSGDYDNDDVDGDDDDNDGDDIRDRRWGWEWCRAWEWCQRMKMLKMRGWLLRSNYPTTADNCGQNGETVSHFGKPSQYRKNPNIANH